MFKKMWDWILDSFKRKEVEIEETPMVFRRKDGTEYMVEPRGAVKRLVKNPDGTTSVKYFRKRIITKSDYGV